MSGAADRDVDLFVIGAGSGGVRAARVASGHGARVVIAEEYRVGGTCVIRGCVPKKLLVYAAHYGHDFVDAEGFGWTVPTPSFDWATLIANKDREIARLEAAYLSTLDKAGVEVVRSRAVLEDANTVRVVATGERIRAKHILIATGATPDAGPKIPGIEHVISSNEALHLAELPNRIVVQGGSYIAVEFACIFSGLGSKVTLVYRGDNILRGFDDDVRHHLRMQLEKRGIHVITGNTVTAVEESAKQYVVCLSGGMKVAADQVMFAIGRPPNVKGLGLEAVGVKIADNGGIAVDEYSQTSVPSIFAVGDVTNRVNLTPVAIREGQAFAETVFGGTPTTVDHEKIPTAVFSEPEVGTIGLTEADAVKKLGDVDVYRTMFRPMKATLSGRDTTMLIKLLVDAASDRVVGAHIVGEGAGEMIQLIAVAMRMGAKKADFDATMAVHPTSAEELVTLRNPTTRHRRDKAAE
ncbi:Glutathione reductase [Rhodovulum sp. PH10]|uniref:glutathione-disulfide reductase n=1 Tax=Rhodovulum sp. PH10 TaxID=1187851 RepID=UPI00027C28C0|nr:glutathione-disulfide reductase [Rhodovulum sp. PH10]EJW12597.1 Glutathione reductase [Rhodovulum sp. PH10]